MLQVEKQFDYITNPQFRIPGEDFGAYLKSLEEAREILDRCLKGEMPWVIEVMRAVYIFEPDVQLQGMIENLRLGVTPLEETWDVFMEVFPETQFADHLNTFTKVRFGVQGSFIGC